jgi:putative oxidoreductase
MTHNSRMAKSAGSGSSASDFGLLVLRLFFGINLFWWHGREKITHFSQMSSHFPNPLHIGSHASLIYALISDGICSILVALGLGTRLAAFIVFVDISVAFYFVHHHPFSGGHGELLLLYIGGFLALVCTGGGRFSLDMRFWGRS